MELKQTDVWTSATQNFQWLKLSNNVLSFENAFFFLSFLQMSMLIAFQNCKLKMRISHRCKYSHNATAVNSAYIKSIGTEEIPST